MATVTIPAEQASARQAADQLHVVLEDVSWEAYEALLKSWEKRHFRLTYDDGRLEIMSTSPLHERCGHILSRLIET